MRKRTNYSLRRFGAGMVFLALLISSGASSETLVVEGQQIYIGTGEVISDGVVVIDAGKIVQVGKRGRVRVPSNATTYRAHTVTPGLIDVQSSVGLAGIFNIPADQDQNDPTGPNQAKLRALDGFNPREPLLRFLLEHGVTLIQTTPGPVNPIAGQAGIFRTHGTSADDMVVVFPSAMLFNLGQSPKETYRDKRQPPATRMATAAIIRNALQEASDYARKSKESKDKEGWERDLQKEALALVVGGDLPAIFTAYREDDLMTALRLSEEFKLDARLAGASEAYLMIDRIRSAGIPVLLGPVMQRMGAPEKFNSSYEAAGFLADAGVSFAIRSGYEGYVPKTRVILFEAAIAAANGLEPGRAIESITLRAARILGVERDYGSLEKGKVADVVLYDGDPFEYSSHITGVISAGEAVFARE